MNVRGRNMRANHVISIGPQQLDYIYDAFIMKDKHETAFSQLSSTFPASVIAEWTRMIELWEENPASSPDPFIEEYRSASHPILKDCCAYSPQSSAITLKEIRLKLAKEEADEMMKGIPSPHEVSASAFLEIGIDLEDVQ